MIKRLAKSVAIGVAAGFVIGFTEEIILQVTHADNETRKKVDKATTAVTTVVAVGTLFI